MRKVKVQDAIGQALCHDITAIMSDGFKGVKFHRGHVITEQDIPALLDVGKNHVYIWEPEADEVHEDDAALAITKAVCGDNLTTSGPTEGKISISAKVEGLFHVNSDALRLINSVEDFTIPCRPDFTPVSAGEKLAGPRIVPLVTKRANVEAAVAIAQNAFPVFSVLPFKPLKSAVIITGSEVYDGRIQDSFEPIMRKKLQRFHADILGVTKCRDDVDMILTAIEGYIRDGAELILLTGGMSVDPDDLTPTAIRLSGAKVITQGVPMQPGNMLMIAKLGKTMLMGVPGASMHSPITSLDVFLPRVFAGVEITREGIVGMGVGGLCAACAECTWPTCYFGL